MSKQKNYFLGCVSAEGFYSDFGKTIQKDGYYTYILKGGPGTGKSTLMKKTAEYFSEYDIEKYFCSSDMRSLDAVVINDKKLIVVDGTSPHVFDPVYPAISQEIINLGDFWDKKSIQKSSEVIRYLSDENKSYHKKAARYAKAISQINNDISAIAEQCLKTDKLSGYKERMCRKLFPKNSEKGSGNIEYKQLSAITSDGYITHNIDDDYTVFAVKDNYFAGGNYLLRAVCDYAVSKGYDIVASRFMLINDFTFEHILIPEIKTAFLTDNFINSLELSVENQINFARFYDKEMLSEFKNRISFNKKVSSELIKETAVTIDTALDIHNKLETYYVNSIDFERLNLVTEKFLRKICRNQINSD